MKFNGIISKTVRSALDTVTSRDDVTHDVKVSCILSRVVEVVQQLYWYGFQGFQGVMTSQCMTSCVTSSRDVTVSSADRTVLEMIPLNFLTSKTLKTIPIKLLYDFYNPR